MRRRKSKLRRFLAYWARAIDDTDYIDIVAMRGKK